MNSLMKFASLIFVGVISMPAIAAADGGEFEVKEAWERVEVEAIVKRIDMKTREVDLMGSNGSLVTVIASDEVKRLNEFKVGDTISADYLTYLSAEFRKPTAEEEKNPLVVVAGAGKAPDDIAPGAEIGAVVKAVVSIEIINLPNMEVTIKGPRGNFVTMPVEDEKMIRKINVGQRLVMTYAEVVALSLVKVK